MKSVNRYITRSDHGPHFRYEFYSKVDIPEPGDNCILVQVKACGLSDISLKVLTELYRRSPQKQLPVGQEVAGVVTAIGSGVTTLAVGDHVTGILPLDSEFSGCAEYCLMTEFDVVKKPEMVSDEDAAASIGDCVRAYTALHYLARLCAGDTILVIDGASPFGSVAIQLAQNWGAKVLATSSSQAERIFLENLHPPIAHVIDLTQKSVLLSSSVMEETGGIGVDCVLDNGARLFTSEDDIKLVGENYNHPVPHKHDIISCLGMGGKWVTCQSDLQLDPPNTQQLFLRGASVCFLFDQIWTVAHAQHGRFQHILHDAMDKVERGIIRPKIIKKVGLSDVISVLNHFDEIRIGKVIMTT